MRGAVRFALAVLVAGIGVLALVALSRAPVPLQGDDDAWLRLSWRLRAEGVGECRGPSPEELERLPPHMRNPDACEARLRAFYLEVEVDGREVLDEEIRPAGLRGDRPIYVHREIPVAPGCREVRMSFRETGELGKEEDEAVEGLRIELRDSLWLEPGEIGLITLDGQGREFVVEGRSCGG